MWSGVSSGVWSGAIQCREYPERISRAWDMDFTLFDIPRSNFYIPLSDPNIPRSDSGAWNMEIKSIKHVHCYSPGRCTNLIMTVS